VYDSCGTVVLLIIQDRVVLCDYKQNVRAQALNDVHLILALSIRRVLVAYCVCRKFIIQMLRYLHVMGAVA
jgi:hypothetical protein